jgi:hypothetical protein
LQAAQPGIVEIGEVGGAVDSHDTGPKRTRRKQVVLGDVRYEITVSPFDQNHRAEWRCERCGKTGAWAPISDSADGAFELAKLALEIHHSLVHHDPLWSLKRSHPSP